MILKSWQSKPETGFGRLHFFLKAGFLKWCNFRDYDLFIHSFPFYSFQLNLREELSQLWSYKAFLQVSWKAAGWKRSQCCHKW